MRAILLFLAIALASPALAAQSFADVCPDFTNNREPDMQIQPDEFTEDIARDIIRRLETEAEKGLEHGELGRPIDGWTVFLKGYLLRSEWLLAKTQKKPKLEIERRRKEFCQFLLDEGFRID